MLMMRRRLIEEPPSKLAIWSRRIAVFSLPVVLLAVIIVRSGFREIEPLMVSATPQETYDAVLALMTKRKWRVVDARQPQGKRRDGHIEAVARTPIVGFRDDVVVRIHPAEDGTRVDMRSASRYGG